MDKVFNLHNDFILIKDISNVINFKAIDKEFNSLKFQNNQFNKISSNLNFFDKNTFRTTKNLLGQECKSYLNQYYGIKDYYTDLSITNSWCNITESGQRHHEHLHSFSVVSGVLYLDDNPDNLNLNFLLKNRNAEVPYFMQPPVTIKMSLRNVLEVNDIYPIEHNNLKNHLILFLSNLPHLVTPNELESSVPRRSISFNTFWKGSVGQYNHLYDGLNTIDYKEVLFPKGPPEINNTIIEKRK